jgi:predicted O-methyltransferase YrrM
MNSFIEIKKLLHKIDPFENIEEFIQPFKMQVFADEKMGEWIKNLIMQKKPQLIIEVGSWMGWSAIKMAEAMAALEDTERGIICVDTWLGATEFWATGQENGGWWQQMSLQKNFFRENHYEFLSLKCGYPSVYYNFLSNIFHKNLQKFVCPFPQTSSIASRWFSLNNIKADLIYIDGSHDYEDVKSDIKNYFKLLENNGIIFGDDYWISDVKRAVDEFAEEQKLLVHNNHPFWFIEKEPS